jgi:molybdenum cofactor cytidylyltransferase
LVLAAGGGTRLGGGKLLLPWRGRPLIVHALEKLVGMPDLLSVTFVLGHQAPALRRVLEDAFPPDAPFPLRVAHNPRWEEGLGASLRCGVRAVLDAPEAERPGSVLVLLGDLPLVKEETLRLLRDAHNEACAGNPEHAATAPAYRGKRGNPVILSRRLFPSLFDLCGDAGARALLPSLGEDLLLLPVDDQGILLDVDSPEDYAALLARQL